MYSRKNLLRLGAWFFLFNTILAILISLRYAKYMDLSGWFTHVYLLSLDVSHFVFLLFIPYIIIYVPVVLIFPRRRVANVTMLITVTLWLALLFTDTFIFDLYRFHINGFVLDMVFGGAFNQIFVFDTMLYVKVVLGLVLLIIAEYGLLKLTHRLVERNKLNVGKQIFFSILCLTIFTHIAHAVAFAIYYKPVVKISRFYPLYFPLIANNVIYKFIDASQFEREIKVDLSSNNLSYPLHPIVCDSLQQRKNILFICIDSWNYRAMNSEVTPNIKELADSSFYFSNHFSGSNGTRGGVFSLFYGLPALYWYDFETTQIGPVFISELIKQNYSINVFANASMCNPAFDRTVFSQVKDLRRTSKASTFDERDIEITNEWLKFTSKYANSRSQNPFFGFLFYDAPHAMMLTSAIHAKFKPSWEYADYSLLCNNTDPTPFYNLYKNCVAFNDSLIGKVIDDLKSRDLYDNTILVIFGDHGQEFNENGKNYWGHNGNYTRAQVGTNLIIHWPGRKPAKISYETHHFDIVPTLMTDALGCKNPANDYSTGKSLFDSVPKQWRIAGSYDEFGIALGKRIYSISFNGSITTFDTTMNEFDNEQVNLVQVNKILQEINRFHK